MRKTFLIHLVAFAIATASASDYEELGEGWYRPQEEVASSRTEMNINGHFTDGYGDPYDDNVPISLIMQEDGSYVLSDDSREQINNADPGVVDVLNLTIDMIEEVNRLVDMADLTNARFETLHKNLDGKLKEFWDRLNNLDLEDESTGTKKTLTLKDSSNPDKLIYNVTLGLFVPDGKSVNTAKTVSGSSTNVSLQIHGFDKAQQGEVPVVGKESVEWTDPAGFFDDITVGSVVTKSKEGDTDVNLNLLGLKNWDKPDKTCSPKLGEMLSGAKPTDAAQHYVLTRCENGSDSSELHYTKIGNFAGGADNAGKYLRTSSGGESSEWAFPVTAVKSGGGIDVKTDEKTGEVTLTLDGEAISVQSEATTDGTTALMAGRRVVFKAKDDSCVKVDVAQGASTNEIVVTIGCYYK